jgi:hypothetical protein
MHFIFNRLFYTSLFFMVTNTILQVSSCIPVEGVRQDCVDTLQQAMSSAGNFFIKVHAGEALVQNGITANVENTFITLRDADPAYATGSTRVLARLYKETDPLKYEDCINRIINQYLHGDSAHPRLVAVESLGKLGYSNPLPEIIQNAQQGEGGFKAMARWVLSNNGERATEDSLAALLPLPDVVDFRGAAYAFRFKKSVSDSTYRLLEQCAARQNPADVPATYVYSACFVHAPEAKKEAAKKQLLQQVQGPPAARYEICEALALKGDTSDLSILESLLKDADNDVRVAAANSILKIQQRTIRQ